MPLLLLGLGLVVVLAIANRSSASGGGSGGGGGSTPPVVDPKKAPVDPKPSDVTPATFAIEPACETAYGMLPGELQPTPAFRKNAPAGSLIAVAVQLEGEAVNPKSLYDGPTRMNMIAAAGCLRKEAAAKPNPTAPAAPTAPAPTSPTYSVLPIAGMKLPPGLIATIPVPGAPPPVEPGQPTIPGTTLSVPKTLPVTEPESFGLTSGGCDMSPNVLRLSIDAAMFASNGSADSKVAASLERFAQQLAFCAQSKPSVSWTESEPASWANPSGEKTMTLVFMDEATKLGQRASEVRARAAGGG